MQHGKGADMASLILKLPNDKYLEWSTGSDAPETLAMSREEFERYYGEEYGREGLERLPARLERADKTGCSSLDGMTLEDCISGNRAGPGESEITLNEIIKMYDGKPYD